MVYGNTPIPSSCLFYSLFMMIHDHAHDLTYCNITTFLYFSTTSVYYGSVIRVFFILKISLYMYVRLTCKEISKTKLTFL